MFNYKTWFRSSVYSALDSIR